MRAPSVPVPTNQLFRGQPERHHRELQIEPVRLEPEEQIDAEDDRKRSEAESVGVAPRPAEQHVERVREDQLGEDEGRKGVDRRPIPAPIQQHRALRAGLQVMLLPQDHLQRERPPAAPGPNEQHRIPGAQRSGGAQKRPQRVRVLANRSQECKAGETERERQRQKERSFSASSEKCVGQRYAPMGAESSARATREPDVGWRGFSLSCS